ncbi:MAG: N-(5'-phosphoribosyl)anthranilate isomerase, partial [Nitrospirota bacterium]|nr:N-(5'-phosphoribosyl)anthranilate isomerase [Nitrospirota bacterium]
MPRIKICGITGLEDAFTAVDNGADALGFVFFAKSPRAVAPENARSIISSLPPFITTVGVFVDEDNDRIEQIISYTGLDAVQFHGTET